MTSDKQMNINILTDVEYLGRKPHPRLTLFGGNLLTNAFTRLTQAL